MKWKARSREVFRALVREELAPESETARAAFEADPELLVAWTSFRQHSQRLDGAGALARSVISDALSESDDSWSGLDWDKVVRQTVADGSSLAGGGRRPLHRLGVVLTILAAAAALLLLRPVWVPENTESGQGNAPVYLGEDSAERPVDLKPVGTIDSTGLQSFTWRYAPPDRWLGNCRVELVSADGRICTSDAREIRREQGDLWIWTPSPILIQQLRNATSLRWEVYAGAPDDGWRVSESVEIWLR